MAKSKKAVLVYQGGIANVFTVDEFNLYGRNAHRVTQSDFRTCEAFAAGMAYAGYKVISMYCNEAGDIINRDWMMHLHDAPFSDDFRPVFVGVDAPRSLAS